MASPLLLGSFSILLYTLVSCDELTAESKTALVLKESKLDLIPEHELISPGDELTREKRTWKKKKKGSGGGGGCCGGGGGGGGCCGGGMYQAQPVQIYVTVKKVPSGCGGNGCGQPRPCYSCQPPPPPCCCC